MLTIRAMSSIIPIARLRNGGIAQLARACGSYPQCPRFESRCRYQKRRRYFYLRLNFGPLVKRLRHRPFTAVTWVRFPYGSPKNPDIFMMSGFFCASCIEPNPSGSITSILPSSDGRDAKHRSFWRSQKKMRRDT